MIYLIYDHSFEGFLTAVFEVYEYKLVKVAIRKREDEAQLMFGERLEVISNWEKAERVSRKLISVLGNRDFRSLLKVLLSEVENIEDHILETIKLTLNTGQNMFRDYGNPHIVFIQRILKKISRERHRMTAFVRFKLAADGTYYAFIEPDFDILILISDHFKSRFADQRWLIYDIKRNKGLFYDLKRVNMVRFEKKDYPLSNDLSLELNVSEIEFQGLWKTYFKNTNISSRKNMKLHLQHVPRRYWKYLTEKK